MPRALLLIVILLGLALAACSNDETVAPVDGDSNSDGDGGNGDGDFVDGDADIPPADGDVDGDLDHEAEAEVEWVQVDHDEPYRPQLHYSPLSGWMNDPNGLVIAGDTVHLMHQHAPDGFWQSSMHWGHATSTDYLHWTQTDTAIFPDDALGQAFSGSAVVDANNDSGLCGDAMLPDDCILVFYTHSGGEDGRQKQSLAYSIDGGATFTPYADNPILMPPEGVEDFRDPKVFYDKQTRLWRMVVTGGDRLLFYRSENLVEWWDSGGLYKRRDDPTGTWECPDVFPLFDTEVISDPPTTWVLLISVFSGGPAGGSGTRYMLGTLDRHSFDPEDGYDSPLWLDYGPDFYAPQSWGQDNIPQFERPLIAWMNNWAYALQIDTEPWQGAMTLARRISFSEGEYHPQRLRHAFAAELADLHLEKIQSVADLTLDAGTSSPMALGEPPVELRGYFTPNAGATLTLSFESGGETILALTLSFDEQQLRVTRSAAGWPHGDSGVLDYTVDAPLRTITQPIQFVLDRSSLELLVDDGRISTTVQVFWPEQDVTLNWQAENGDVTLDGVLAWRLRSIWATPSPADD